MKKLLFLITILTASTSLIFSQNNDRLAELQKLTTKKDTAGWLIGSGLGFDFMQLIQINPSVGAGENRLGFGGVGSLFANYKKNRLAWDNGVDLLFGVQKLGSGYSILNNDVKAPFQKSIDEIRLGSKLGYKVADQSKFYYSLLFTFLSQLAPTYSDTSFVDPIKGNYLKDVSGKNQGPIAKFFSPARITLSPGIDYKPNQKLSFFLSPASLKMVIVGDDNIAAIPARDASGNPFGNVGIHGNEWRSPTDYDKTLMQLGATLNGTYVDKFLNDKLTFKSGLTLFSNYLKEPQNIDVDWTTETAYMLFKGLSIALNTRLFYDHDIPVQITDYKSIGGVNGLGRRVSFTENLYIKYNYVF